MAARQGEACITWIPCGTLALGRPTEGMSADNDNLSHGDRICFSHYLRCLQILRPSIPASCIPVCNRAVCPEWRASRMV